MREHWESFKLWKSQYRREIRRAIIAALLFYGAVVTDRWIVAGLILVGTLLMFLAMKFGEKYQILGNAMIANKLQRNKTNKKRPTDQEKEHLIEE